MYTDIVGLFFFNQLSSNVKSFIKCHKAALLFPAQHKKLMICFHQIRLIKDTQLSLDTQTNKLKTSSKWKLQKLFSL